MTSFPVLNLHDPEIRIDAAGAGDVGVKVHLLLGARGPHPDGLPVYAGRFGEKPNLAAGSVYNLDENRPRARVALVDHDGEAPSELDTPDEGGDPDVRGEFQASRRWSKVRPEATRRDGGSVGPWKGVSMPHPRTLINPAALGMAMAAVFAAGAAAAAATDLYYERSLMAEAGDRCNLFTPQLQSALVSGREQARGAALRGGSSVQDLRGIAERARARARSTPCDSPDLGIAAQRVRSGFAGYARLLRQDFPGDVGIWKADRSVSAQRPLWRLSQDVRQGGIQIRLGIASRVGSDSLMVVTSFPDGARPYAARIVMRDRRLTSGPYLDARGEGLKTLPLQRRMPRVGPFETYSAESRSPAGADLLPPGMTSGWAFRFPNAAAGAMADLDPREAIRVEFLFASGPSRQIYLEVGDFAAARAFLSIRAG